MELQAVLELGGFKTNRYLKSYPVVDCRIEFNRMYNEFGPSGSMKNRTIEVWVIAPGKNDLGLFEWYTSQGVEDGAIIISSLIDDNSSPSLVQRISFDGAQCVGLSEIYDIDSQKRRTLKLRIMADYMAINDIGFISD